VKLKDLPVLEGWMSLPDAARALEVTRQRIHQQVDGGEFKTARRIGTFAIVREAEVLEKVALKEKAKAAAQKAQQEAVQEEGRSS
jgi:hypothetical protein